MGFSFAAFVNILSSTGAGSFRPRKLQTSQMRDEELAALGWKDTISSLS
jgi:hypothetical protein